MIKEYCDCSSALVIPVANVVGLKDNSVVTKEPVGAVVKLKNSDVLANLDTKLGHLLVEERDTMTGLINDFQEIFTDVPRTQIQSNV